MPRKGKPAGNSQRPPITVPGMVIQEVPALENLDTSRQLTEAEKAEMEANPLPVQGTAVEQPPKANETEQVEAAQDKAYPVLTAEAHASEQKEVSRLIGKEIDTKFMEGILKCHTCGRTGEEDLAECPNAQLPNYTCPEPTAIDPDTDVVLHSGVLGVIRTVPIASLVKGHAKNYLPGCHTDDCGYKVLHPKGS